MSQFCQSRMASLDSNKKTALKAFFFLVGNDVCFGKSLAKHRGASRLTTRVSHLAPPDRPRTVAGGPISSEGI